MWKNKWAHVQYRGKGRPHLDLDFNFGGLFWVSFSIFGQDLETYHHVMLNLSSPRMPAIDGTIGFFYFF
jgi:hypothetical protein